MFHRHDWILKKTQVQCKRWPDNNQKETIVLYHCNGCGDSKTKTLDGEWTLEDILTKVVHYK